MFSSEERRKKEGIQIISTKQEGRKSKERELKKGKEVWSPSGARLSK